MNRIVWGLATLIVCWSSDAHAQNQANQGGGADAESVAKQLATPVADLVSVPLQFNWDQGVGPNDELHTIKINLQEPVVPLSLNDDWNLIGRMILPFINQHRLHTSTAATSGTGDMLVSGFFWPESPRGAIWGIGPAVSLPMTTNPFLGTGKWAAGPTAVVLKQSGQMDLRRPSSSAGLAVPATSIART